jgi:flavin reductase (DIM6/NTAB) family NADH-FMN oxidoreductase RutF
MSLELREAFRQSMRRMASTVSVIACAHEDRRYGITATAVTSLSVDPASVLVCINSGSSIIEPLMLKGRFSVNMLQRSQVEIARRFGGAAVRDKRFVAGDWEEDDGVPSLADAQATLFCTVDQIVPYSTHRIVIARVDKAKVAEPISPLLYQDGAYAFSSTLPIAL